MTVEPDLEPGAGEGKPSRPSIEERAARREYVERTGHDRYDSLLRHLRAGREIQLERKRGWRDSLDWHPVANRIVLVVLVAVAVYLVVSAVASYLRENAVDTWAGPDASVQSGQRLASCPQLVRLDDPVFPTWIRYDGKVYQRTDSGQPMNETNIGTYYIDSGYTLGDMRLYDVTVEGLGPPGSRIIVLNGDAPAGQVYRQVEGCS